MERNLFKNYIFFNFFLLNKKKLVFLLKILIKYLKINTMAFSDFMHKYWWKNLLHKVYSWGAAVVLVGALFKITHWPGATIWLTIGLLTEALIFVVSGLEPPHEELDWTLVYPELKIDPEDPDFEPTKKTKRNDNAAVTSAPALDSLAKFDAMLDKAGEDGLFEKLNTGLNKMSDNVNKLSDISDSTVASKEFSETLKSATNNVNSLSNSVESINYSAENLSDTFNKTTNSMKDIDFGFLGEGNKQYNDKLSMLNKNLTAINAIFEMQLGEANLEEMVKDVQESAVYAKKYSQEITNLSKNLSALNNVYGNMLTAMNVKID